MDQNAINTFQKVAAFLVQAVADEQRQMAFVEVADPQGERGLVVVIRGNDRIERVLPSLRKLCPEDVVRDGNLVEAKSE